MSRLPPISDRESPPGVGDITRRSSTEVHEDQQSRGMSVADRLTPNFVYGQKAPMQQENKTSNSFVQTYNIQNNTKTSDTSVVISPRSLSSRAYLPTPYRRSVTPDSSVESKDVKISENEKKVVPEMRPSVLPPIKVPRYSTPVPYSRSCTPFSPVNWPGHMAAESDGIDDNITNKRQTPCQEDLHISRLVGSHRFRNSPLPPIAATTPRTSEDKAQIVTDLKSRATDVKEECIERYVSTTKEQSDSKVNTEEENELIRKVNKRKEQLINMASQEPQNSGHQEECRENDKRTNMKETNKEETRTTEANENEIPPTDEEMQMLKLVFEEHLKGKEEFERLIEKREQDINEQLREMDELLESVEAERLEVEKTAGEFADAMMKFTNFKEEATRVRVQHMEQEISSEILFGENEELKEEIRELLDEINAIKERRAIGLDGIQKDIEEMNRAADMLKEKNNKTEADIKEKAEEFDHLRMLMSEQGIEYVTDRKPIKEPGLPETGTPKANIPQSPPKYVGLVDESLKEVVNETVIDLPECSALSLESFSESSHMLNRLFEGNHPSDRDNRSETETFKTTESLALIDAEGCCEYDIDGRGDIMDLNKHPSINGFKQEIRTDVRTEIATSVRHGELAELKQQSVPDQIRLLEARKTTSRIPRPVIQPYGSASRDGERYVVSRSNSMVVSQRDSYRRDKFVPEDNVYVTKPTMNVVDPEVELRRQKRENEPLFTERHNTFRNNRDSFEIKNISDEVYPKNYIRETHFEERPTRTNIERKEIKSKIDTGLKNNKMMTKAKKSKKPANIIDTSFDKHRKETQRRLKKYENAEKQFKSKQDGVERSIACLKSKELELPPLRNTPRGLKDANRTPSLSKSFIEKPPLSRIKPISHQEAKERPRLPPIKTKTQTITDSSKKAPSRREAISEVGRSSSKLPPISKVDEKSQDLSLSVKGNSRQPRARSHRLPPIISKNNHSVLDTRNKHKAEAGLITNPPLNGKMLRNREQMSPREKA